MYLYLSYFICANQGLICELIETVLKGKIPLQGTVVG